MSLLNRIVTVLKTLTKWLGVNAGTWQSPSSPSDSNKHSKSGGTLPPNQHEKDLVKTELDITRLSGTDNKGKSLDRYAGLSEDQDPSEPFDNGLPLNVTKTGLEVDTSDSADPRLDIVSSNSDDIHDSPSGSVMSESNSSDASAQPIGVRDKDYPSRYDKTASSDGSGGNAELSQSPKVPRKPRNISGRRSRVPRRLSNEPRAPRVSRPELLCYKNRVNGRWEVGLSVDEDSPIKAMYLQDKKIDVVSNECPIPIPSLTGQLVIEYQDGRKQDVKLFEDKPLIFKLPKNWAGNGRMIAAITRGYFIVLTPTTWNRTGHMPVAPEGCSDTSFLAHYFYRETQSKGEHISGFRECESFRAVTGIKLSGQLVFDDSEEGDLFVQRVPKLILTQDIVWARVGREVKSGWKGQNFKPAKQTLSEILHGREGRFFLRVYDSSGKLLDSTAFRFLRDLKQICVNDKPYTKDTILLPDLNGYPSTEVRFVGIDDSYSPQITLCEGTHATVKPGVLAVDRNPVSDCILCTLGSRNHETKIKLDLPRIWWKIVSSDENECEWQDEPFKMTRQEFQKHAYNHAEIHLLQKRLQSIRVGFDNELNLNFRRRKGEYTIPIPLSNFVDHVQIDQRLSADAQLKVELAGKILQLIVISADPLPKIESFTANPMRILKGKEATLRWVTSEANQAEVTITPDIGIVKSEGHCIVNPAKTTTYTLRLVASDTYHVERVVTINVDLPDRSAKYLRPRVQCHDGSGWRNAKGFSHGEVRCAGLTLRGACRRSIRLDARRRTVHQINIKALKTLLNE